MVERVAYSPTEAAQLLGIHRGTIYNLERRGEIRIIRLGRRALIPRSEIDRILTATESSTHAASTMD